MAQLVILPSDCVTESESESESDSA